MGLVHGLFLNASKSRGRKIDKRLTLWTHSIQEAAGKIYAAAGFKVTNETEMDVFGAKLKRQNWELEIVSSTLKTPALLMRIFPLGNHI